MNCSCPTCGRPIDFQDIRVDTEAGIIVGNGRFATLTVKEFTLFELFWAAPGRVLSKSHLLDQVYSLFADDAPTEKIIDVFICKMRKKLDGVGVSIETVWGQGYRLNRENP